MIASELLSSTLEIAQSLKVKGDSEKNSSSESNQSNESDESNDSDSRRLKRDMATIRIAETVHPLHPTRSANDAATSGIDDGIYNMRAVSRSSNRDRSRDRSGDRWTGRVATGEKEAEDDDPGLRQSGDFKHKQVNPYSTLIQP